MSSSRRTCPGANLALPVLATVALILGLYTNLHFYIFAHDATVACGDAGGGAVASGHHYHWSEVVYSTVGMYNMGWVTMPREGSANLPWSYHVARFAACTTVLWAILLASLPVAVPWDT